MEAVTIQSDFESKKIKSATVSIFSRIYLPWSDRTSVMIFVFECRVFHSLLSPSSRSSLVPLWFLPLRVVSSAYLRLLILLLAVLIPACDSSSPACPVIYPAYKLNNKGWQYAALTYSFPNLELVHCSMSGSNCCFLTCIQISQEAGKVVWYSNIFKNFLYLLWSTQSKALA